MYSFFFSDQNFIVCTHTGNAPAKVTVSRMMFDGKLGTLFLTSDYLVLYIEDVLGLGPWTWYDSGMEFKNIREIALDECNR